MTAVTHKLLTNGLRQIASGKIPGHKAVMWIEDHAKEIIALIAASSDAAPGISEAMRERIFEMLQAEHDAAFMTLDHVQATMGAGTLASNWQGGKVNGLATAISRLRVFFSELTDKET